MVDTFNSRREIFGCSNSTLTFWAAELKLSPCIWSNKRKSCIFIYLFIYSFFFILVKHNFIWWLPTTTYLSNKKTICLMGFFSTRDRNPAFLLCLSWEIEIITIEENQFNFFFPQGKCVSPKTICGACFSPETAMVLEEE